MSRLPLLLLGLVGASLVAIIANELDNDTVRDTLPSVPRQATVGAPAIVPPEGGAATGERIATLLARPLFNPDRRPVAGAASSGPGGAAELPRLTGILIGPTGRSAIFAGADERRPVVLREGGSLGAFTVRSITPTQVTVLGPAGPRVLRPSFDGAAPAPGPTSPGTRVEIPFGQLSAPSGLDILRNAARGAPPAADGPPAAVPGVDQLGLPARQTGTPR